VRCATRICNVSSFGTDHLGYRPAASIPSPSAARPDAKK
jgi:hypothetical protein